MAGATSFPPEAILRINEQLAALLDAMAAAAPTVEPEAAGVVWVNNGILTVSVGSAPVITLQPVDAGVFESGDATFSVAADYATSYQWQLDSGSGYANISGATSASYAFTPLLADDGNLYHCLVTGPGGSVTSDAATLSVTALRDGWSYKGDGSSYVSMGDVLNSDAAFAVRCYINGTDTTGTQTIMSKWSTGLQGWSIKLTGGLIEVLLSNTWGTNYLRQRTNSITSALLNGSNHYLEVIYDGSKLAAGLTIKIDGTPLTLPAALANTLTGSIIHGQEMRLLATNSGDYFRNHIWEVVYELAGVERVRLHCEEGGGNSCWDVRGGYHGRINSGDLSLLHNNTKRSDSSFNTVGGTIADGVSYYDGIVANNKLANPSFESGRTGWNFTETGGNTATASTEQSRAGLQSIKMVKAILDAARAFQAVVVVPGDVLKMSGWHYGDGVNNLYYEIHNNTVYGDITPDPDNIAGQGSKTIPGSSAAEWRYFEVEVTIPSGCTSVNCYYYSPFAASGYCYWDKCAVTLNAPAPSPIPDGAVIPRDERYTTDDVLGNLLQFTGA